MIIGCFYKWTQNILFRSLGNCLQEKVGYFIEFYLLGGEKILTIKF